jgi:prevent-host-death family protein
VAETYSTYEAKSRFSEIIRRVREGRRVVISYHGEPVAEISPIVRPRGGLGESLAGLERDGLIAGGHRRPAEAMATWRATAKRPGALKRFLKSRDQ